ncbi:MAG: hypothetical protein JSW03_00535 [Candidatus Eiseniibacteriota bacterium]|nr:MAG: hypothetical protein JSW03_00535 [Candidatus Eisenbacteria bacterium]
MRTLADGHREPGTYVEQWDGRKEDGSPLSSGVYFYCLETAGHITSKKMVLLR